MCANALCAVKGQGGGDRILGVPWSAIERPCLRRAVGLPEDDTQDSPVFSTCVHTQAQLRKGKMFTDPPIPMTRRWGRHLEAGRLLVPHAGKIKEATGGWLAVWPAAVEATTVWRYVVVRWKGKRSGIV